MTAWPDKCARCRRSLGAMGSAYVMSYFNTDAICTDCSDKERQHPDFQKAVAADCAAIKRGDYNFPGIGKPKDL